MVREAAHRGPRSGGLRSGSSWSEKPLRVEEMSCIEEAIVPSTSKVL